MLNAREEEVLNVIIENVKLKGYPPSVREIGEAVGLSSSSTVHSYLKRLEQKGYLRRDPTKPRAIEVIMSELSKNPSSHPLTSELSRYSDEELISIPLLGEVAAGVPLLAVENYDEKVTLPRSFTGYGEFFMLSVRGDSMIEAGILPGDLVLVRRQESVSNGDIAVALLEDEATVKRFYKEKNRIRLQPENSLLSPIYVQEVKILGKVVGLMRKI
ncbi:SOS-response transcriptional repressor, LexA [Desulforamulus reducens MI-1]|uniref:LexA repressor n=1 Tax=Desulforamulus reducens (strain ATCC BAA-1160 / DSM 100696 / MI-1) TaxID=349161 RepID=LEXA_DESRM|nr:transcriptional repressor LexA [Desulforamulus reducens]A4J5P4.1 RecName: Full=LexA repressor [Desulforamulus reducens MI-1]ABO50397.1 SOS-response transcriptional repressor, LexA [Desulforamulus reducens MI-1]